VNKCSAGKPSTTSCTTAAQCNVTGACTSGNVGATCTTNGTTSQCGLATGICSNTAAACTSNTQCAGSTGHCSTDTTQTCTANGDCLPYGHCSVQTGNRCRAASAATDCPTQPGTLNPVSARCDTTGVSGNVATTLLADANGPGLACRRNNHAYAGVLASRFNYPSGNFTTPITGEITAGQGCSATPRFANVPRHYWKTSVEWCDTAISTAADKWLGYGDITQGTCQADQDSTHIYARFYQFGSQTDAVSNYTTAAFAREDLTTGNTFTHTSTDVSGQTTTVTRTYAQEMENYANWFAYYRDRIQAVKTATSLSFLGKNTDGTYNLDETKFRVGLHTLSNNPTTSFVNIQDFDLAQKALWATQLFDINIQLNQETPSLNAMARIGDYFTNGTSSTLAGATDPIVLSCQKNWHMFFTDGITNQPVPLPPLATPDTDNNVLMLGNSSTTTLGDLTVGSPWPAPYREDSTTATDNSLSDYATQYWSNDMRSSGPVSADNVPTTNVDPANWQHLNFAALSLGTQGKLAANNQTQVLTQLTAGTLQWPVPYPSVNKPDASGVDDLWHAAVNGRGRFVNAKSVAELQVGMGQILADALNSQGSRSAATFTNNNLSTTADSFVYEATFQPSWGGTLAKYLLNPTDGTTVEPALWHAETQLAQMLTPTTTIPNPWRDSRKVVTMTTSGTPVPFLWANLSAAQQDALAPGNPARGQLVLAYLRGDQSNEGATLGQFRERNFGAAGALGDIVDSSAAYAGPPNMPYLELYDPGYSTFKSTWASRPGRVYVGANDGMLHAFDDATGNETFGYIPRQLFSLPTSAGLGALTYQFGGLPPFVHHFLVDSTPTITDVAFGDPSSQDWHTLLVGGLGKGGQAYYAIDVTNPGAITSETLAASTVKWEFTDPDMGYTYGPPLVTKTRAYGGQWVVVVPSGYNNASGVGKLWFLDAATGSVLTTMTTGDGSPTDPSGLAQISGYTQYYVNYLADQIYAGDLHGNVWRFDIMDPNPSNWTVSKLAVLTDPSGTRQPVTIRPQIQIDLANATDRWVFVGTGKLLDDSDLSNTQVQTFYALRDGNTKVPSTIDPANPIVRSQLDVVTTSGAGLTAAPAVGWLQDLTDVTGQRVVTPIVAVVSIVAYAATSPNTDPCITGQPAEIFARSYSHGDSRITDDSGSMLPSIYSADGAVGINIVSLPTGASSGGGTDVPQLKGEITLGSTGKVIPFNVSFPPEAFAHRMSWRVLNE
jgi:type IV pilus assembly protein PilY1